MTTGRMDAETVKADADPRVTPMPPWITPRPKRPPSIRAGLALLHQPGEVFELRALDAGGRPRNTASGYFDDLDAAAEAAWQLDKGGAVGVYHSINPLMPALLARAANRAKHWAKVTATDSDVLSRRWLLLDIDPPRPSGICATDAEKAKARETAAALEEILRSRGWPHPLLQDSGNGVYLLFSIAMDNTPDAAGLLRNVLLGMNVLLTNAGLEDPAKVDLSVFNPARIARVPGTTNRKGDSIPDRPHRVSELFPPVADCRVLPVAVELLQAVAAMAPNPKSSTTSSTWSNGHTSRLDLPRYLQARGVAFRTKPVDGANAYLIQCPFDAAHGQRGESSIVQASTGLLTFHCMHDSCQGRQWHDVREALGAPRGDEFDPPLNGSPTAPTPTPTITYRPVAEGTTVLAGDRGNIGTIVSDDGPTCKVHFVSPEGDHATKTLPKAELSLTDRTPLASDPEADDWPTEEYDAEQLATMVFQQHYLIDEVLVELQPAIAGGPSKSLKTGVVAAELAVCLAAGVPWLKRFNVPEPVRVGVISAESGMATLQETIDRIARSKGLELRNLKQNLRVTPEPPNLCSDVGINALLRWCKRRELRAVIVDPAYLNFPELAAISANVFAVGQALRRFATIAIKAGITPIIIHHTIKALLNKYAALELQDLSGSGWCEFARQWILLNRRSEYIDGSGRHELHLRIGGSAGHSSLWHLNVEEGEFCMGAERVWRTNLTEARQARADAARAKDESSRRDIEDKAVLIVQHLEQQPNQADTETGILKGRIGRSNAALRAFDNLKASGRIIFEPNCVLKGGRKSGREGYRLQPEDSTNGSNQTTY